jgi:hypothetical protein
MIPEVILTALLLGWALNGKFNRLTNVKIVYAWMIFVPLGVCAIGAPLNYRHVIPSESPVFVAMWIVNLTCWTVFVYANRRIPGAKLMMAGLIANLLPIIANGTRMPVSYAAVMALTDKAQMAANLHAYPFVKSMFIDGGTRLWFLCDLFAVKRPYFPQVFSVGDIVTSIGGLTAIIAIMRTPLPGERKPTAEEA